MIYYESYFYEIFVEGLMDDGWGINYYLVGWEEVYEGKMGGWLVSFIYYKLIDIIIHIFSEEAYKINIPHPISHHTPQKSHKIPIKKNNQYPSSH